ncbi:hypothetical protein CPB86DRAFT_421828 [Serendipita vermifera]|nr:hypothetical protein CPB86DRAFT_421828 [Serendipita vermifera]
MSLSSLAQLQTSKTSSLISSSVVLGSGSPTPSESARTPLSGAKLARGLWPLILFISGICAFVFVELFLWILKMVIDARNRRRAPPVDPREQTFTYERYP